MRGGEGGARCGNAARWDQYSSPTRECNRLLTHTSDSLLGWERAERGGRREERRGMSRRGEGRRETLGKMRKKYKENESER